MTKEQFDFFEKYKLDNEKAKKILESADAIEQLDHYFKQMTEDVVNDFATNLNNALPVDRPISRESHQKNSIAELTNSLKNKTKTSAKQEPTHISPKEHHSDENQPAEKPQPTINYIHENQSTPKKNKVDHLTKKLTPQKKKKETIIKPIIKQKEQKKQFIPLQKEPTQTLFKRLMKNIQSIIKKIQKDKNQPSSLKTKHIDLDRLKKVEQEISDLHNPNNKGTTF
tara:strand:+ start:1563 stop:2240 length:678 start_codon:yes stop_codon:yes gene_type:complete